jgi:CHAT domain-containing protein
LSLVNEDGEKQNGFLSLQDVFNLRLATDLVVLSACQTGLGKEIKGEGIVGLTYGFMYAGSKRVMASLWKVDDRATADLMRKFYQAMLGPQQLSTSAALRNAQLSMIKNRASNTPFYWAAFQLQGEWR